MQLGAIATALDIGLNDRCSAYHQRPAKNVSQRAGLGNWIRSLGEVMRQNVSRDSLSETKMPCEAPPKSKPGDELQSLLSDWVDRVSRWTSSLSSSDNQLLPSSYVQTPPRQPSQVLDARKVLVVAIGKQSENLMLLTEEALLNKNVPVTTVAAMSNFKQ